MLLRIVPIKPWAAALERLGTESISASFPPRIQSPSVARTMPVHVS